MLHQCRADALPLILVDHDEGHFGAAGLHDDVTSTPDDDGSNVLFHASHQSDMAHEVDVHEERDLLVREIAFCRKETAVKGLAAGAADRRRELIAIVRAQRTDFDRAAIRKVAVAE